MINMSGYVEKAGDKKYNEDTVQSSTCLHCLQEPESPFLESLHNWRARKAVAVYIQDRGFNSFASNMIKPSVNETKWSSLITLGRTCALILYILDLNIWSRARKIPGLSRKGPPGPEILSVQGSKEAPSDSPGQADFLLGK